MYSKKGEILLFIKEKPRTTKEIRVKFGNSGCIWTSLDQLEADGIISKPKIGHWECINSITT